METEKSYKERILDIAAKIHTRDDLHEVFIQKIKNILTQFAVDFAYMEEDFDPQKISMKRLNEFVSMWVDLHIQKE